MRRGWRGDRRETDRPIREAPTADLDRRAEAALALNQSPDQIVAELLEQIDEHAPRLGIKVELVVREGSPYSELLQLAEERKVDAIVVGASTQAGHRFVGSLAAKLVRHAAWPVTVVP